MSGSTFFGLSLISGSKLAFALAVMCQISHYWFLSNVEECVMTRRSKTSLTEALALICAKSMGTLFVRKPASRRP